MDLAEAALLASTAGCVLVTVFCLSVQSGEGPRRSRWPLFVALAITVVLGGLVVAVLLVASRHGVVSVEMDDRMPGTASAARVWGLAGLAATVFATAALVVASRAGRPQRVRAGLAAAAAALFVLALASGWWADVEQWAG
jgi:hypothetical protein